MDHSFPLDFIRLVIELLQMDHKVKAEIKQAFIQPQICTLPLVCVRRAAAFICDSPRVFLTVRVALAELLTEILGHNARAGAVTGMFRMVTGLVVVHLGR